MKKNENLNFPFFIENISNNETITIIFDPFLLILEYLEFRDKIKLLLISKKFKKNLKKFFYKKIKINEKINEKFLNFIKKNSNEIKICNFNLKLKEDENFENCLKILKNLEEIIFGDRFNQKINNFNFQNNLVKIEFGDGFNQKIEMKLPNSLKILIFG